MSYEFIFYVGTMLSAEEVLLTIYEGMVLPDTIKVEPKEVRTGAYVFPIGTTLLQAHPEDVPDPIRDIERESWGVEITRRIYFPYLGKIPFIEQKVLLIQGIVHLMKQIPGDLLFSEEDLLLLNRKANRLRVSDRMDYWTTQMLTMLPLPFEVVKFNKPI